MKLNEFKELQELDLSHVIGSFGAAGAQQVGNRLLGRGEGQLSVKDKMAKNTYISDFVGRASTDLASAIESGLVDTASSSQPTQQATPQQPVTPTQPDKVEPQQTAQLTPAQIRQQKQALAAKNAQAQMKPVNKVAPTQPAQLTPAQIRQQKLAAATTTAQQQMAPVSKLPANQPAIQAQNIRQRKQAAATATANQQAAPFSKVSTAPAVWKSNRNPNASAQTKPTFKESSTFDKLNSIFESILRFDEAETTAPTAPTKPSISSYVQSFFKKYMKNVNLNRPDIQAQIKSLADAVQSTYKQDKGKAAFTKLANLGYALSYSDTAGQQDATTEPQQQSQGGLASAFAKGAGLTTSDTSTPTTTPTTGDTTPTTQPSTVSSPEQAKEKEKSVYMQVKDLLSKLDKKGKQRILAALEKQLPTASTTPPASEPSAMSNMARQLSARGQTSTGGTQVATGRGMRHIASPTNPNQASNIDAKLAKAGKRPARVKAPVAQ